MQTPHTPGPWHVSAVAPQVGVVSDDQTIIARLDVWRGKSEQEMEANAALIAAAPELLAACELALSLIDVYSIGDKKEGVEFAIAPIRAAILKAKGAQ